MYQQFSLKVLFMVLIFAIKPEFKVIAQSTPQLGAEVFLEPGQTPLQVEHWVKELSDNKMPVARVFMLWNYLEPEPDVWDFTLYDALFKAGEKYGVKITPTLVPNQPPFFWGEDFFYSTHNMRMYEKEIYRERSKYYIEKVVERYKNSPALDSWWIYNEPSGRTPQNEFAVSEFRKWLEKKYITIDSLNKSWQSYFSAFDDIDYDSRWQRGGWTWHQAYYDWNEFGTKHINNQIQWVAEEVRKYDQKHPFHTNPAGIFSSLAHYDLPGMKKILNSLGASMHPSWTFGFSPREKYGLTASWGNDILFNVANKAPNKITYWVSELQAGNNLYRMGASPKDIAQWTWTSIGAGAERVIYWCLNYRMAGNESAEWAMLDFQQNPSERMIKAAEIANVIHNNQDDFTLAKPIKSPITVITSPRTSLMQQRKSRGSSTTQATSSRAHQEAAMACYNSLMQQGIPVQVIIDTEYDWETKEKNQCVILADVRCLTMQEIMGIEKFVNNGNKVIATGFTGLWDENEKTWIVNREFPLKEIFGGSINDIFIEPDNFKIKLDGYEDPLPAEFWYTKILPSTGKVIGMYNDKPVAVRNNYREGSVLWIPSMIAIGAWVDNDISLAHLLNKETEFATKNIPFRFGTYHKNCYMRTLKTQDGYITMIFNGNSNTTEKIEIISSNKYKTRLLYGEGWNESQKLLTIGSGETVVIKWE